MSARISGEVELDIQGPATQRSILDALEVRYHMLCGTILDHIAQKRRPFLRFFACGEWSIFIRVEQQAGRSMRTTKTVPSAFGSPQQPKALVFDKL